MTDHEAQRQAADSHWSDCAVHNGPALPAGLCDCCCEVCGAIPTAVTVKFPRITMRYCKSFACVVDMLRSIEAIQ